MGLSPPGFRAVPIRGFTGERETERETERESRRLTEQGRVQPVIATAAL